MTVPVGRRWSGEPGPTSKSTGVEWGGEGVFLPSGGHSAVCVGLAASQALAQSRGRFVPVTDSVLEHRDPAGLHTWCRTLDGWGYGPLDQIDRDNVRPASGPVRQQYRQVVVSAICCYSGALAGPAKVRAFLRSSVCASYSPRHTQGPRSPRGW